MELLMLLTAMAILLNFCQTDEKVSFYGSSYIHFPVQEAKGSTDVSFRFRTHLSDAILLLAAGKTDYCLIKLETGRLKVHINLGAGESEISSPRGLILNDLSWHEIQLTRREANMTLKIDVIHVVKTKLPGRFFVLNVLYGIYIGGLGDFNELFLGHIEYMRGCMADIMYNGADVIEYTKSRKGKSEATAVTWSCSAEFDATRTSEISFLEENSFISISKQIPRSGSRWYFELKTTQDMGLLLYNAGQTSHADYLGIELFDGKIRLLMNKGNGATELIHSTVINDGKWHKVIIDFNPNAIGINIDEQNERLNLPSGGNRYLDLAEILFIGGAELNKRAKAIAKGIKSGDRSYLGCIRNMKFDSTEIGLPDVKISQGILVGCVWSYPCVERQPCIELATCAHFGVNSFQCICDQPHCVSPNYINQEFSKNDSLALNLEAVRVKAITVLEGKYASINFENIKIALDIAKYGINEDGIMFNVVTPPKHGRLNFNLTTSNLPSFTLNDVYKNKIQYIHDGSESLEDLIILELKLTTGIGFTLPGYLQSHLRFPLYINITPVNDPPLLEIPTTKVLRLAQGTRKTLNKELVWTIDPDTPADMLVYTVLRTDIDSGHVEKLNQSSSSIDTFTQSELANGLISYVHHGNTKSNAMLGLQVSDGYETSKSSYLRISAYPLQLKLKSNTGLVVVHQSYSYLTPANLSFATNSDDLSIEILYTIIVKPQYGLIQKLKEQTNYWINILNFTNKEIESGIVRYLHNTGSPIDDRFKFQASVKELKTHQTFDFKITFIDMELKEINNFNIEFNNNKNEIFITNNYLKYQTNPLILTTNEIKYTILTTFKYGYILNNDNILAKGDQFTQKDIDSANIKYHLYKKSYSKFSDYLTFQVDAPQCESIVSKLIIIYIINNSLTPINNVENISVDEGSKIALKINNINLNDYNVKDIIYNITELPKNGWLSIQCYSNQTIRSNITSFNNNDLLNDSVYYIHDDSETTNDTFQYIGISNDDTDFMYIGYFSIKIILKNDNPPARNNDHIFDVVINGERLITNKDLEYIDNDIGTNANNIIYIVKNITNGELYSISDSVTSQLNEFTQKDINDKMILFKHSGNEFGKIEFDVSDGQLYTSGYLKIRASLPYVKFLESNSTIVQFNNSIVLELKDIDIITNINKNDKDILFTVINKPKHGVILNSNNNIEINKFTRDDLINKLIIYKHLGGSMSKDEFRIKVMINNINSESRIIIKVYAKSYWEPLIIINNNIIQVEESTSVLINKLNLEVGHNKIPATEITYLIREWPRNGYLEIQTLNDGHIEETKDDYEINHIKYFDQSVINDGRLYYVQSIANQTDDHFIVDITNGITWLRDLYINFIIIPDKIYIKANNISVIEGKSVVIKPSLFHVITNYYNGKLTDYRIIEKPKHGIIIDSISNNQIKKFLQKHLDGEILLYKHNGDESYTDYFKVIVSAGDKLSQPVDVWINIHPIDDQMPSLIYQKTIKLWRGGTVNITSDYLLSKDNDTESNKITYNIIKIQNAYFSLINNNHSLNNDIIYNFTQSQIDNGLIQLTHINGSEILFSFTLFDGIHTSNVYNITIETVPINFNIIKNNPLNIFPLTRKIITDKHLLSICSDVNREIEYIIKRSPNLGKIIMETNDGTWQEVDRFTQRHLNLSKVTYEHTKQFMDLSTNDSFVFDVETPFAEIIKNQVFQIDVSVSSGGLGRYIVVNPVQVEEGGSALVTMNISGIIKYLQIKAGIKNPMVLTRLINQPKYGHVMLLPDLNITIFSQSQIEGNKIIYYHDHSDSIEDTILFEMYLMPGHVVLYNVTIGVVISPVNDQPFKLVTKTPFISVVQNQSQTITDDSLLTVDPDTPAEEIIYDVISGPTAGRLLLLELNQNSSDIQQINKFTQHDIHSNRLVYEHSGSSQSATFYFRVSDGRFTPVYTVFNIQILPIKINITKINPIIIQQSFNMGILTDDNIKLDTNARQERIIFEITNSPKYGILYVRDVAATKFKHPDILSKSVVFVQTDMSVGNDSFIISIKLSDYEIKNIRINIKVIPLMIIKPMIVFAGEKNQLKLESMDATPLAKVSNENPLYRITMKSKYCKLKRIIRSSGDKKNLREREIIRFTHQEIISGIIFIVCRSLPIINNEQLILDYFHFVLKSSTYQPADGIFEMRIKSDPDISNSTLGGPMDPVGHEGEISLAPNINYDYFLIIGMLLGVFVLGVLVIVTIRCRHKKYKNSNNNANANNNSNNSNHNHHHNHQDNKINDTTPTIGVIPLPRPPDHLMPSTPHLKRFGNEHLEITSSTPLSTHSTITSSLPQCKVIPLNPLENITNSDADVSARYPYGVADADDWSSFDTSELPCPSTTSVRRTNPLLRRNQYWV